MELSISIPRFEVAEMSNIYDGTTDAVRMTSAEKGIIELNLKLIDAGFNLGMEISVTHDLVNDSFIYTQKSN